MPPTPARFLDLPPFTLDLVSHTLLHGNDPVNLPPLAAALLRYLIENRDRYVTKNELKQHLWRDVAVETNAIEQQISKIRRALGDSPVNPRFIETRYKLGWRFIAVATEPANPPPATAVARLPFQSAAVALAVALVTASLTAFLISTPRPAILRYVPLTNDGRPKQGRLLTNGRQVFFVESLEGALRIMSVPAQGGDSTPLPMPCADLDLQDISSDGGSLLVQCHGRGLNELWIYPLPGGPAHFLKAAPPPPHLGSDVSAFHLNSSGIAALDLLPQVAPLERAIAPWEPEAAKWSADGKRVRFSLFDGLHEAMSLWEADAAGAGAHRLSLLSDGHSWAAHGTWTRDGRYYVYEAGSLRHRNLWISKERAGLPGLASRAPIQLTAGASSWSWPTVSPSGSPVLFALNQYVRSELVRFDPTSRTWRPAWNGASAYELDFAPGRASVAYVRYPDHTLWKCRPDGSGRFQLTGPGFEAHQPHWSPDGTQIAFMARKPTSETRILIVSSAGGPIHALPFDGNDQGVPTWSPDGSRLLFGELLFRKPLDRMSIHFLSLRPAQLSSLPGSHGLWSPRWSPDGKYICALAADSTSLRVSLAGTSDWKQLASSAFINHASWSPDSRFIYFVARRDSSHFRFYRVSVPQGQAEMLADLADFTSAPEDWYGVAPGGDLLASRSATLQDIYALECRLP
jgi:Tol biopolymer transport system component/DNA-binding winged helix-turn-helix (wHTH) protein